MNTSVLDSWRAPAGAGYDQTAGRTVDRVVPMLAEERVAWLSTVRPDGTLHLVPTWFWWNGDSILVYSKPGAVKVRNLRANPRLMVALGDPDDDFSVGLIEAVATIEPGTTHVPDAFFAKYAAELSRGGLDPATFRALYRQAIRIVPTRFLAWHGRGERHEAPTVAPKRRARAGVAAHLAAALGRLAVRLRGGAMPLPASAGA